MACALGVRGHDNIYHMPYCRITTELRSRLGLSVGVWSLKTFLLAAKGLQEQEIYKIALLHFGLYSVYNHSRHRPGGGLSCLVNRGIPFIEDAICGYPKVEHLLRNNPDATQIGS